MSGPISLRNIPPHALHIVHQLCEQTGLSIADVLRQAIVSGVLVEATRCAPSQDGTLGGLEGEYLAKALRRHLGSAIDLLMEYGQHPYQGMFQSGEMVQNGKDQKVTDAEARQPDGQHVEEQEMLFESAIGDDLEMLGIGMSFQGKSGM